MSDGRKGCESIGAVQRKYHFNSIKGPGEEYRFELHERIFFHP